MSDIPESLLENYKGRTILITGAGGFIGSNLGEVLSNVDCNLILLSRSELKLEGQKAKIKTRVSDLTKPLGWVDLIPEADIIFHLASQTSVYSAEQNPIGDAQTNIESMINLLEALRKSKNQTTLIYAGTVTQAGMPEKIPMDENVPDNPITLYDLSKLTAERYLMQYIRKGWVRGASLRLANVYGPSKGYSKPGRGILNLMIQRALAGEEMFVYENGKYIRDYIFITDVIAAFLYAGASITELNGGYYIISGGEGTTIREAFQMAIDQTAQYSKEKLELKNKSQPEGFSEIETRNFVGDSTAFNKITNWSPQLSLKKGISQTVNSYLSKK
jgi:UDP-glucose 4-epimerase